MRVAPAIEAFGSGGFRIAGVRREGSVLIVDDAVRPWAVRSMAEVTPAAFQPLFDGAPAGSVEFVLLGTGAAMALPPRAVRDGLARLGLGLEFMDTAAACRLYNVLAAEGRRIAAALIAV